MKSNHDRVGLVAVMASIFVGWTITATAQTTNAIVTNGVQRWRWTAEDENELITTS